MHEVSVKLEKYNCTRVHMPSTAQRRWFDSIEPELLIHELNLRASLRKNGYRVLPQSYVSYYDGGELCIGVVVSIFVGSRIPAPFIVGCAVCAVRKLDASRLAPQNGATNLYRVVTAGPASSLELVCCTKLKHKYFQTVWDENKEAYFALVRFEEY